MKLLFAKGEICYNLDIFQRDYNVAPTTTNVYAISLYSYRPMLTLSLPYSSVLDMYATIDIDQMVLYPQTIK